MNKTIRLAAVAATLLLAAGCGNSTGQPAEPEASPSASFDCGSANSEQEWDKHHCDEKMGQTPDQSGGPQSYPPSTDKIWTFTTELGCTGTLHTVDPVGEPLLARLQNYTGKTLYAIRADIDYRHPTSQDDRGCGITPIFQLVHEDGSTQEPVDYADLIDKAMDPDDTDQYNKGVTLNNTFQDKIGASPMTKGVDYAIFTKPIKPFIAVSLMPHGALGDTVYAQQK